jgi:hypothetical protein
VAWLGVLSISTNSNQEQSHLGLAFTCGTSAVIGYCTVRVVTAGGAQHQLTLLPFIGLQVDVSVAVQTPIGLLTPIVRDADVKGLAAISSDVKTLAKKVSFLGTKPAVKVDCRH